MLFASPRISRRSKRQWITLPVGIHIGSTRVDGVTINLSEHGMYVFAATNLSVGTEVEVTFHPPDRNDSDRICGVVRRRAVYLYGIEFLKKVSAAVTPIRAAPASATQS